MKSEVNPESQWTQNRAVSRIVTIGDPRLRRKAELIDNAKRVKPICEKLILCLRQLNGAGLSAPQVGEPLSIIVVEVRKTEMFPDRPESPLYVMINPNIVEMSNDMEYEWEGCFSVPGLMGIVPRYKTIRVQYVAQDGIEHDDIFGEYLARVVQHECDHLAGIEFLSRMESTESISTVENWRKFNRPTA